MGDRHEPSENDPGAELPTEPLEPLEGDDAVVLPDPDALIGIFYPSREPLGRFIPVPPDRVPDPARQLLVHEHHMTVTVEAFHGSPVDVIVRQRKQDGPLYAREILLVRQSDRRVVQYGIMRINFDYLEPDVVREIVGESIPLGRVLIQHDVLRRVEFFSVFRIQPGPELIQMLELDPPRVVYGRTALIHCNGEPAIELIEIVN